MNLGTVGFLMNEWQLHGLNARLDAARPFKVTPLQCTITGSDGRIHVLPAINEVSVLRETRQTAKLEVTVNNRVVLPELAATAYWWRPRPDRPPIISPRRGPILPLGSNLLALTPISPFRPRRWRGAILPEKARISIGPSIPTSAPSPPSPISARFAMSPASMSASTGPAN